MNYNNYYPDVNKFKLAGPPDYWLRQLYEFDPSLVVIPSRQECIYRLCQRRKLNLPEHITNDILFKDSDTKMIASYSLVPVTTIIATANWGNPLMFDQLRRMAPHRNGGADKVINDIEDREWAEELDRRSKTDEMLNYQAKDAWGYYLMKLGVRSHMYIPKTKNKVDPKINKAPSIVIANR